MKGVASASVLALALQSCGTEWWPLFPLDAGPEATGETGFVIEAGFDTSRPPPECTQESDCLTPKHCDTMHGECVQCVQHTDCQQQTLRPWCSPLHMCVKCLTLPVDTCEDAGQRCDSTSLECYYPCSDDGQGCPSILPFCNGAPRFRCVECRNNGDCADAAFRSVCYPTSGTCVESVASVVSPPAADGGALDAGDAAPIDAQTPDASDASD